LVQLGQLTREFSGIGFVQGDHLAEQGSHALAICIFERFQVSVARVDGTGMKGFQVVDNIGV